jgi:hypothetical protein
MIQVFHASETLLTKLQNMSDERSLMQLVMASLNQYHFATQVKSAELDIAFAATGGKTRWVNGDKTDIEFTPTPNRATTFGDLLIEQPHNYINLATPAGFIPLVDLTYSQGQLNRIQIN